MYVFDDVCIRLQMYVYFCFNPNHWQTVYLNDGPLTALQINTFVVQFQVKNNRAKRFIQMITFLHTSAQWAEMKT